MQHRHTPPPAPQPTAFARWRSAHPHWNLVLNVLILLGFTRGAIAALPLVIALGDELPADLLDPFLAGIRLVELSLSFLTAILWLALLVVVVYAGLRTRRASRAAALASDVNPQTAPPDRAAD